MMESRSFSNIKYRLVDDSETIVDNLDTLCDNDNNNNNSNKNNICHISQENEPATLYTETNNIELDDNYTENVDIQKSLYESALENNLNENKINKKTSQKENSLNKKKRTSNSLMKMTIYSQKNNENRENKYVDDSTLNSYMAVTDIDNLKNQTNDNIDILKNNISKVYDRDTKLTELEEQTEALQNSADRFKNQTSRLKRRMLYIYGCSYLTAAMFISSIVYLILKLT